MDKKLIRNIKKEFDTSKLPQLRCNIDAEVDSSIFWGHSLFDLTVIDRFTYKGKGRPRKTDYTTFSILQYKMNVLLNKHISHARK